MAPEYGPAIAAVMGVFALIYWILSVYGLVFVLAYRWIKRRVWVSTAAWLTGVTIGLLGIALAIVGVFASRETSALVLCAASAICGTLTLSAARISRRLNRPGTEDSA